LAHRPADHRPSVTAGLKWPAEIWPTAKAVLNTGQPEGESHADETDSELVKGRGNDAGAASSEDQPEHSSHSFVAWHDINLYD
jgi:hypothetical protein